MRDPDVLSRCILDNNASERRSVRRLRGKALIASIVLECAVLSALVIWPLLDPAVLPKLFTNSPAPPYRGVEIVDVVHASGPRTFHTERQSQTLLLAQPPRIPNHISMDPSTDAPASSNDGPSVPGVGPGTNGGPFIPGTEGRDLPPEIRQPAAERKARQQVSEGVMEAMLVRKVLPSYPLIAKNMRLSGSVVLHAVIGTDGSVRQLQVLSGNILLARAALEAVREWRYQPTRLSGEPVEVETTITVNFILDQN